MQGQNWAVLHVNETWIFIVCLFIGRGLFFFKEFLYFRKMEKQTIISKSHVSLDILFPKSFVFKNRFCVMFGNSLTIWFYILRPVNVIGLLKLKPLRSHVKKNHIKGVDLFIQFNFFWRGMLLYVFASFYFFVAFLMLKFLSLYLCFQMCFACLQHLFSLVFFLQLNSH